MALPSVDASAIDLVVCCVWKCVCVCVFVRPVVYVYKQTNMNFCVLVWS